MIKAELIKPLDGDPEGTVREFDQTDFDNLVALGAVRAAVDGDGLRNDGPTIEEYVSAGYKAKNYPPQGYASRSTAEEIAVALEEDAKAHEKTAPGVENKMAPAVANKADGDPYSDENLSVASKRHQNRKN